MRRGGNEHVSSRFAFTPHFPDAAPFHPLAPSMKSARTSTSPAANAERNERRRIAVVATVPYTVNMFLAPHLAALARRHDVTILANGRVDEIAPVLRERCDFIQIGIAREIAPLTDLRTLAELRQHFQTGSFDLVLSMTPKAGLLAMVTARIVGVPTRVHWFTGQVWATRRGLARRALKLLDGVTANCATHLLSDSPSQRIFLEEEGVIPAARVEVLADGSACGVDARRFKPDRAARNAIRRQLRIPDDAFVALFVGRLNRDKGIPELAEAFAQIAPAHPSMHLILAGPDEGEMIARTASTLAPFEGRVHRTGFVSNPEAFMAAADLFVLPSHRESFGLSVVEAAACGIPAIGCAIYGLCDAIVDGETGLLVPKGDAGALASAIAKFAEDSTLRTRLGTNARARVLAKFSQDRLVDAFLSSIERSLHSQTSC
jgi:glycosyltransferase involved in cell wall biosynthesis